MGKSSRQHNARLAELRKQQQAAERKRRLSIAAGTVAIVLLVVVGLVYAASQSGGSQQEAKSATSLDQATFTKLTTVPTATLDAVGLGTAGNGPRTIDAPTLTRDGKPLVLYVGAEYCPFCASQRWGVVVALSRFGTWNNLGASYSAPAPEVHPDTPTVTFHGATYSSPYLTFTGYETATNKKVNGQFTPLDTLSDEDEATFKKFNAPPYMQSAGAIPWINFGGTAVQGGASYASDPLMGRTHAEIATALQDPTTPIAQGVNGTANLLTAQICRMTNQQPADVCTSPGVVAAASALK